MIFAGISGVHVIPVIITCTLQGMFCDMGIPAISMGENLQCTGASHEIKNYRQQTKLLPIELIDTSHNSADETTNSEK